MTGRFSYGIFERKVARSSPAYEALVSWLGFWSQIFDIVLPLVLFPFLVSTWTLFKHVCMFIDLNFSYQKSIAISDGHAYSSPGPLVSESRALTNYATESMGSGRKIYRVMNVYSWNQYLYRNFHMFMRLELNLRPLDQKSTALHNELPQISVTVCFYKKLINIVVTQFVQIIFIAALFHVSQLFSTY